jgi:hypothetical protein
MSGGIERFSLPHRKLAYHGPEEDLGPIREAARHGEVADHLRALEIEVTFVVDTAPFGAVSSPYTTLVGKDGIFLLRSPGLVPPEQVVTTVEHDQMERKDRTGLRNLYATSPGSLHGPVLERPAGGKPATVMKVIE